jgi:hypothetical protein
MRRVAALGLALFLAAALSPRPAAAYRPFDGTDAAVADPGEAEIELGPVGFRRDGAERTLIAPAAVLNLGVARGWEAVLEGQGETPISREPRRSSLAGTGLFLKGMLRPGSLQEKPGPSVATEFGVLLAGINTEPGVGASAAAILSQRWPWGTVHLNAQGALARDRHADLFLGAIVEGPYDWPVRPVAEVFHEREFGVERVFSGLVGAIWQVRDALAFDAGLRAARVNDHTLGELRLGVTFAFPVW